MMFVAPLLLAAAAAAPAPDYAKDSAWLCLPGRSDTCSTPLPTTALNPNGYGSTGNSAVAKNPPVDCFYVYPTVSRDPGMSSDLNPSEEKLAAETQFARFASVCRPFAPLYRQFTLTALIARMSGQPLSMAGIDPKTGYNDVVDAWNYYLAHYNNGRGVVLIGHSQGSSVLIPLIKNEIEGKPVQKQLVSAILMGTRLQVPEGKDVGGDLASTPLCHAANQLGCAIAYASFRATAPPKQNSLFGKPGGPGLEAACVNPAALGGGSGAVHAYFGVRSGIVDSSSQVDWIKGKPIATPFVSVPGLLTAECGKNDVGTYLGVALHPTAGSPRTADIPGDVLVGGDVLAEWGLHLIDASLFMGNLIGIVREEAAAYTRKKH